jgi:hypothetical protein
MVQLIETDPSPSSGTQLRYRIAYDPPHGLARIVPPIERGFKRWFEVSLDGLGRLVDGT